LAIEFCDYCVRHKRSGENATHGCNKKAKSDQEVVTIHFLAPKRRHHFRNAIHFHLKEKDAVLPAQQAKQAAAGQNVVVGGEMAVVRLITYVARRRIRSGSDSFAELERRLAHRDVFQVFLSEATKIGLDLADLPGDTPLNKLWVSTNPSRAIFYRGRSTC
jgi:hypothetical protein